MIPTRVNDAITAIIAATGAPADAVTRVVCQALAEPVIADDALRPLGVTNLPWTSHKRNGDDSRRMIVDHLIDLYGPKARPRTEGQGADIIHIAGPDVMVGSHLRQRCGWCGAALVDQDLDRVAVLEADADRPFPTWPVGALIGQVGGDGEGSARWVVEHEDGSTLPLECCAMADPEATR